MKKIFRMAAFMLALGSMTAGFTSCGEDDENGTVADIAEQISFDGLNVVAQANGQVLIYGKVTANTKIKSLVLSSDADGKNVIKDLLKDGDLTKVKAINDEGEKEKSFTLDIPTAAVDVQTMYLVGKTKGDKQASSAITETIEYKIGASKAKTGSYVSITENKQYFYQEENGTPFLCNADGSVNDAVALATVEVIAASSDDGYTVTGIKRASEANSKVIAGGCGKTALFGADGKAASGVVTEGTIVTKAGAICKFKLNESDASGDATFTGITMKSGLGAIKKVDVSQVGDFSK
jgi:hypothetical protein